ncbi:hypothetical protein CsSME_00037483 [Camellia sinensis var. sinensis]
MTQPNPPLQLQQREPSHRSAVDGGMGEAGNAAGARDGEEDAGTASEEGGGGVTGGLLVVEGDESDAKSDDAVGEGGDGDADKAEHAVLKHCDRRRESEVSNIGFVRRAAKARLPSAGEAELLSS